MKKILPTLLCLLVALPAFTQKSSISVSGNVSGTWDVDTVYVLDDIDVEMGDSLKILPGVYVEFTGPYSFYVRGHVRFQGEAGNRIRFSIADTIGFSNDSLPVGGWNGIQFFYNNYTPDSSVIDYCEFSYGKAVSTDSLENYGGAVCARRSERIRISNSLFTNCFAGLNGGAIYLENTNALIRDNVFVNNRCGPAGEPYGYGGAICSDFSSPTIIRNQFSGNNSTGVGGAAAIRFQDARVCNNVFRENFSALGGAIGYLHYDEYYYTQCNNLMLENAALFFGGGIASLDAGPTFVNNTLSLNSAPYGGAFYVKDSIVPVLYNCILWNNLGSVGHEVYLWDAYASADFYYCDIEGGYEDFEGSGGVGYQGNYEHNFDLDPLFSAADDFRPLGISPCLDSGTPDTAGLLLPYHDLDGFPRIDPLSGIIDLGCYEFFHVGLPDDIYEREDASLEIFPNPASSIVHIRVDPLVPGMKLGILDPTGKWIMNLELHDSEEIQINIENWYSGVYVVFLLDEEGLISSEKLLKR